MPKTAEVPFQYTALCGTGTVGFRSLGSYLARTTRMHRVIIPRTLFLVPKRGGEGKFMEYDLYDDEDFDHLRQERDEADAQQDDGLRLQAMLDGEPRTEAQAAVDGGAEMRLEDRYAPAVLGEEADKERERVCGILTSMADATQIRVTDDAVTAVANKLAAHYLRMARFSVLWGHTPEEAARTWANPPRRR